MVPFATRTFSFAPSTSQIVCAPRWYTFLPGGCLRVHFFCESAGWAKTSTSMCASPPHALGEGKKPERTICTSHEVPSIMYLKHRSQTHRTPPTFSRLTAPAKRSIVRPCPRTSSPSPSVSGYGEKYLGYGGRETHSQTTSGQNSPTTRRHGRKYCTHQVLICQGPKLTLSKFRRAEAIVGKVAGGCVVSRASGTCAFASDGERRRLRVLVPFTRRDGVASWPGDRESRGGVFARTVSAGTHSSRRLSVPM